MSLGLGVNKSSHGRRMSPRVCDVQKPPDMAEKGLRTAQGLGELTAVVRVGEGKGVSWKAAETCQVSSRGGEGWIVLE